MSKWYELETANESYDDCNITHEMSLESYLELESNITIVLEQFAYESAMEGDDGDVIAKKMETLRADLKKAQETGDIGKVKSISSQIDRLSKQSINHAKKTKNKKWLKIAGIGVAILTSLVGTGMAVNHNNQKSFKKKNVK